MLLKIVYVLTWRTLGLVVVLFRGDRAIAAEVLVLRHEDTIVRWHRDIVRHRWAARSMGGKTGRPPARPSGPWSFGWPGRTPNGATAGSRGNWPAWECESRRRPCGRSSGPTAPAPRRGGPGRPGRSSCVLRPRRSWPATSSQSACPAGPELTA